MTSKTTIARLRRDIARVSPHGTTGADVLVALRLALNVAERVSLAERQGDDVVAAGAVTPSERDEVEPVARRHFGTRELTDERWSEITDDLGEFACAVVQRRTGRS